MMHGGICMLRCELQCNLRDGRGQTLRV